MARKIAKFTDLMPSGNTIQIDVRELERAAYIVKIVGENGLEDYLFDRFG